MDVVAGHRPQLYYQDCSTIYYVFLFLWFFFFFLSFLFLDSQV